MTTNLNPNVFDDEKFADELLPGTPLLHGQYVIERYLNSGGFGITYLAKDSLHRRVVIKECFPSAFCRRSETIVGVRSRAHTNEFRSIVKLFVQEARNLARLSHPNIVGVHQVFEDNDTAYMALDYVDGTDLLDIIEEGTFQMTPAEVDKMLRKVLDAIKFIHSEGVLHRDISPDNILVTKENEPVLIDFGAARETATKASRVLTAMRVVKDGYSPQEFYLSGSEQYPSSDLYALGASIYHLLVGETPPNSQQRLAAVAGNDPDPYVPIAARGLRGYERPFLTAIDKSLNIFPKDRLQSAAEWLAILDTACPVAPTADRIKLAVDNNNVEARIQELVRTEATVATPPLAAEAAAPVPRRPARSDAEKPAPRRIEVREEAVTPAAAPAAAAAPDRKKGSMGLLLGTAAAVAVMGVGVWQFGDALMPADTAPAGETAVADATPVADAPAPEPIAGAGDVIVDAEAPVVASVPEEMPAAAEVAAEKTVEPAEETAVVAAADVTAPVAPAGFDAEDFAVDFAPAPLDESRLASIRPQGRPSEKLRNEDLVAEVSTEPFVLEPALSSVPPQVEQNVIVALSPPTPEAGHEIATITDARVARFITMLDTNIQAGVTPEVDATAPLKKARVVASEVLELAAVLAGTAVDLPFTTDARRPTRVAEVGADAPDWLRPGMTVASVNGMPVSNIMDIHHAIKSTTQFDAGDVVTASFSVEDAAGNVAVRSARLDAVQKVVLLNGDQFQSRKVGDLWQTTVVSSSGQGENSLQPGDQILSYLATGEAIDGPNSLAKILDREIAAGVTRYSFAVKRDAGIWIVSMRYNADLGN